MSSFQKGDKSNYIINARFIHDSVNEINTLFNCEGDKVWVPKSIYNFEIDKSKLAGKSEDFIPNEGFLEIPAWFYKLKFEDK